MVRPRAFVAAQGPAAFVMEPNPLVSIVLPVLDGERFLRESLDSILSQTYPRLEVIVMDDGSTDATPKIMAGYHDRVAYVRQGTRRGIYANANDGIVRARGELVGVFHADDVYEPELVAREVDWLHEHPEAGAVFCSDVFVDAHGVELGRLVLPPELRGGRPLGYGDVLNGLLVHKNRFLRCPTALVRAEVYRELGGYRQDEFENTADLEMWLRIARRYPLGVLEDHLLRYRRGHGSSSERYHALRTDSERFFTIMDLELAAGGRAVARRRALRAYEAHRAEDTLMRTVSNYVRGDLGEARRLLAPLRLRTLSGSRNVRRMRLALLTVVLRLLVRLPRVKLAAWLFVRRWHGGAGRLARSGSL